MAKEEESQKMAEGAGQNEEPQQGNAKTGAANEPSPKPPEKAPKVKANHFEFILDIPLEVSVELGRTRMIVNDLLQLGQGSVIELTKLAGEPMEILVNQKLIARGEVVVVNEKFGVRLTDIISPMERVEQLR